MIKQIFFIFILSLPLFAQKVIIYSECDYQPYSYCEDGQVKGISIDIFKSIFLKLPNYELELKGIKWKEAMRIMKKGVNSEIKMLGTISYQPKSRPFVVDYSKPFIYEKKVIYCNREFSQEKIKWPEDFYHLKIAKMKGFARSKELETAEKDNLIEVVEGNATANIMALLTHKVDCYINDEVASRGKILKLKKKYKENNISTKELDQIKKIINITKKGDHIGYHIGFSAAPFPEKKDLIKNINIAIQVMHNSNEIEEIKENYLKSYLHPESKRKVSVALYNWGSKFVSEKLDGYGVIPEIVSKALASENISVDYEFHHHNYDFLLTKWGKTCMSIPWLNIRDRERYFYFSDNIKPTAMYFFYNTKFNSKGSIKNDFDLYNIGGIEGFFYEKELFDNLKTVQYTSFKNWKELIDALLSNKIDVVFAEKDRFYSQLNSFLESEKRLIVANDEPLIRQENYAIFSKKCKDAKELRDKFNRGLKRIKKRGIFDKILKKYNMTIDEFNGYEEMPKTVKVDEIACQRSIKPYTMAIYYTKNKMRIDGYISSLKQQNKFLDRLRKKYPNLDMLDEFSINKGEPKGWINVISDVAGELKYLIEGSMKISGKNIEIAGKIDTIEEKRVFEERLNRILKKHKSKGYRITTVNIILLNTKIKICQKKFNTFLEGNKIIFDIATDIIKPSNEPLILNLYQIAQSCPKTKIHIIGHTDNTGVTYKNNLLSLSRAKAVFRELNKLGISSNKMKAIGKGESVPRADNSTPEGQEKNRRIEFKIIGY